ncbi:hypothetical protein B0H14DRAFT_2770195 [Mycena olivaceomarginata]|nr:hypothetical protein B0H14DRAFT_2770195 [Mycena olivaceomarginata]
MLLRWGQFVLAVSVLSTSHIVHARCAPAHKFVTRTPALDDTHQSVDTLGMLLRWGAVRPRDLSRSQCTSISHCACALRPCS